MARRESGVHGFEPEKKDCGGWNAGEARGSKEPGKEFHAQEGEGGQEWSAASHQKILGVRPERRRGSWGGREGIVCH